MRKGAKMVGWWLLIVIDNNQLVEKRKQSGVIWGFELKGVGTAAGCHCSLYLRIIIIIMTIIMIIIMTMLIIIKMIMMVVRLHLVPSKMVDKLGNSG